jgi:hypothetical protein
MTDRAQALLRKMRASKLFGDPKATDRILDDFSRSTLDDVGPVGGHDQSMRVLGEMNELGEEQIIRDSFPRVDVL